MIGSKMAGGAVISTGVKKAVARSSRRPSVKMGSKRMDPPSEETTTSCSALRGAPYENRWRDLLFSHFGRSPGYGHTSAAGNLLSINLRTTKSLSGYALFLPGPRAAAEYLDQSASRAPRIGPPAERPPVPNRCSSIRDS